MTTTVGIVCKDGIVLASDRRSTMGNLISSKTAKKIHQIDDRVGMTTAGCVGHIRTVTRIALREACDYKIRRRKNISVRGLATFLSNVLNSERFSVQLLIGGVNKDGIPHMYSIDAVGGDIEEEEIAATGSGCPIAYGVLDDNFVKDISTEDAINIAVKAITGAVKRDNYSGEAVRVAIITKEKYLVRDIEIQK